VIKNRYIVVVRMVVAHYSKKHHFYLKKHPLPTQVAPLLRHAQRGRLKSETPQKAPKIADVQKMTPQTPKKTQR